MEKPGRNPELTRLSIVEAAMELFVDRGFAEVSTAEIAAAAGVTKSLIHHHFGSKQRLWDEVKDRLLEAYCDRQQALVEMAGEPTPDLLDASLQTYFEMLSSNPQLARVIAWASLEGTNNVTQREREINTLGVENIRQGQIRGHFRADLDPRAVIAMFQGVVEHWLLFRDRLRLTLDLQDEVDGQPLDRWYLESMGKIFLKGVLSR
jgi:TetR/AcrR family transcriptional regulator